MGFGDIPAKRTQVSCDLTLKILRVAEDVGKGFLLYHPQALHSCHSVRMKDLTVRGVRTSASSTAAAPGLEELSFREMAQVGDAHSSHLNTFPSSWQEGNGHSWF